jgi:hypothetical protein
LFRSCIAPNNSGSMSGCYGLSNGSNFLFLLWFGVYECFWIAGYYWYPYWLNNSKTGSTTCIPIIGLIRFLSYYYKVFPPKNLPVPFNFELPLPENLVIVDNILFNSFRSRIPVLSQLYRPPPYCVFICWFNVLALFSCLLVGLFSI